MLGWIYQQTIIKMIKLIPSRYTGFHLNLVLITMKDCFSISFKALLLHLFKSIWLIRSIVWILPFCGRAYTLNQSLTLYLILARIFWRAELDQRVLVESFAADVYVTVLLWLALFLFVCLYLCLKVFALYWISVIGVDFLKLESAKSGTALHTN